MEQKAVEYRDTTMRKSAKTMMLKPQSQHGPADLWGSFPSRPSPTELCTNPFPNKKEHDHADPVTMLCVCHQNKPSVAQ